MQIIYARQNITQDLVTVLEVSYPDIVANMLEYSSSMYPIGASGTVTSASSGGSRGAKGRLVWEPRFATAGLTQVAPS
eukprot:SAG31_NODE_9838_length_1221_cov_2.336898_2_plen_77_part_01